MIVKLTDEQLYAKHPSHGRNCNDLDIETLELLEEMLDSYSGTMLLVSHDRDFINNVVTSTIVFEGEGEVKEYVGGYDDWLRQRQKPQPKAKSSSASEKQSKTKPRRKSAKLSYKDQRELDQLPADIAKLEERIEELHAAMASPDFYQQDSGTIAQANDELANLESKLEQCFERWEALEAQKEALENDGNE